MRLCPHRALPKRRPCVASLLVRKRNFIAKAANAVLVTCLVAGFSLWMADRNEADAVARQEMLAAERAETLGPYANDGTFTGTAQGYGGPITVEVTVERGYIARVEVVDAPGEDAPYLAQASTLADRIVEAQTPNVDTVTGATFSSAGIINGCVEALREGGN